MSFRMFHEICPGIGLRETRSVTQLANSGHDLPADDYAFFEMYCSEAGCDCRRVVAGLCRAHQTALHAVSRDSRWLKRARVMEEKENNSLRAANAEVRVLLADAAGRLRAILRNKAIVEETPIEASTAIILLW